MSSPAMTRTYGAHNLTDQLYRTTFGFVGTARPVGAGPGMGPRLIKVFSPAVGDDAARSAEADMFVARAMAQQKLASRDGAHWGRIYDLGRTPDGAFYVTDYHPLTLRKLLDARLDVSPGALHRIVSGIVDGLRELRDALGRAHGNLKPSNILLVGRGEKSSSGVALTDMASPSMAASVGEAGDRFVLGQIIHELVLQRPFDEGTVWPLPPDPTWSIRLGAKGDGWRQLCEDLLAPAPPPNLATLAQIAKAVRKLAPPRAGVRRLVPLAVVALVLLAVAGGILYAGYNAQQTYCTAKRNWLGEFAKAVKEPARRQLYQRDPALKKVVAELDAVDPATIDCDQRPVPLSVAQFKRARRAMQSLDRISVAIDPDNWARVQRAVKAQRQFRGRGWQQASEGLARLIEGIKPGAPDLASRIDQFLLLEKLDADVADLDVAWKALDTPTKSLLATDGKTFQAVGRVLRESAAQSVKLSPTGVGGADVMKADAALASRAVAALAAANAQPPTTDLARFTDDFSKDVTPERMTVADVERWLGRLDAYAIRTADIAPVVAALRDQLGDVSRQVLGTRPDAAKRSQFDSEHSRIETEIGTLERTPLIESEVRAGVLTRRKDELSKAIDALIKYSRPQSPTEWVQSLDALGSSSDRLNDYWQSWKRVVPGRLGDIDSPAGIAVFDGIKKSTNDLRAELLKLDRTFPKPPDGLPQSFAAAARTKREQAFDALISATRDVASGFPPDAVSKSAGDYSSWTKNLVALAKDFPLRKSLVGVDDAPDEAWHKAQPAFWADPLVRALVEADVNRLLRVRALKQFGRDDLREAARADAETEVVLSSWQLLGQQKDPPWPTQRGELFADAQISHRLLEMLRGVSDPAERDAAVADVRRQLPLHWRTAVEAATSERQLEEALEQLSVFGVTSEESSRLRPEARFNLALFKARLMTRKEQEGNGDDAMRPYVEALKESAGELRAARPSAADLLYKLDRLDAPEPFSDKDPGSYFRPEIFGVALEFKRVELRNVRPFYLQTTELTVDQFARLLGGAQAWDTARRLPWGHPTRQSAPGPGPRAWEWTASLASPIGVADFWMHPEDANDYPPEFLASRFNKSALKDEVGGNPSLDHPMQQMSAQTALYVAGLTGCRLPTTREWLAAYAVFEKDVSRERWNLRDATWDAQRKHIASSEKSDGRWPDAGIFAPAGLKVATGVDAAPALRATDGTLFFRRESDPGGGTFHHLVGNVAELVCDAPGQFDAWQDRRTPEGVAQFAGQLKDKLFVIGGSALSPAEVAVDSPYPLGSTERAYADVGVRLAFTAPVKTLAERLKWVLMEQPYTWNESAAQPSSGTAATQAIKSETPSPASVPGAGGATAGSELNK